MEYAQLNEAGTDALQVTTHGDVEWDANNFCSAEALTKDGKAEQFRVVPLTVTEQPAFDAITQRCFRNDSCSDFSRRATDFATLSGRGAGFSRCSGDRVADLSLALSQELEAHRVFLSVKK